MPHGRKALLCVKPAGTYLHMAKPQPPSPGSRSPPPLPSSARRVSAQLHEQAEPVPHPAGRHRRGAGLPAGHLQCTKTPLRCSSPRVSQSLPKVWGRPFPPAWRRQHLCSLYPTAPALTGASDKQLHAERPRGASRDRGETGCQCTEGRSR